MKNLTVRRVTPDEGAASPDFQRLVSAYWDECANRSIGPARPDIDQYRKLAEAGALHCSALFDGGRMVGFVAILAVTYPHFSKVCATVESIFLDPDYRCKGGGALLLKAAREMAKGAGAVGLYISAPVGSRLARIARAKRWRNTNSVFFIEAL